MPRLEDGFGGITPTGFTSQRYELVDIYEKDNENVIEKKKKKACKLVEVEDELKVIDLIYQKFGELKSLTKLETYLLQNKITTKQGANYSVGTLRFILTNPVYAKNDKCVVQYFKSKGIQEIFAEGERAKFDGNYGFMAYNKLDGEKTRDMSQWIIAVGLHKGRINGEDWVHTQELIEKNADKRYRANIKNEALFSGILKCSKCGSYMRPKMAGGKQEKGKTRRFYYTCELKDKSKGVKCDSKNIAGLALDKIVMEKLKDLFVPNLEIGKELKKLSIGKENDQEQQQEELSKKYKKNQEEIKNLINSLKNMGEEVVEFVNSELMKIKEENKEIEEKLKQIEKNQTKEKYEKHNANLVMDIIHNYFETFDCLDLKLKKDILKLLIEDMKGEGKKVEINLLNTKIEENTKWLFSNNYEETALVSSPKVANRKEKQSL